MKFEFFTNEEKTEKSGADVVKAPAFSITKVQTSLAALIAAIAAVVPKALEESDTIWIASIAAGTVVILGGFALAAVDMIVRQRAQEAKLRYGGGSGDNGAADGFLALPKNKKLVLQKEHSDPEYEVEALRVGDGEATLIATRDGDTHTEDFHNPEKPK